MIWKIWAIYRTTIEYGYPDKSVDLGFVIKKIYWEFTQGLL